MMRRKEHLKEEVITNYFFRIVFLARKKCYNVKKGVNLSFGEVHGDDV